VLLVILQIPQLLLQGSLLANLKVEAHVFLFEDLILDLLIIDLLEDFLDVVLGLLEDPFLLSELNAKVFYLHIDLSKLAISFTYLADDILSTDLVVATQSLDLFLLTFKAEYFPLILLHLHTQFLNHLQLLRCVFFNDSAGLAQPSHSA
jgi:hypothetical protein